MLLDTSKTAVSRGYGARAAENESHCASERREGERERERGNMIIVTRGEEEDGTTDRSLALAEMVISVMRRLNSLIPSLE